MYRTSLAWVVLTSLLLNQPSLAQEFKAAPPHLRGEGRERLLLRETVQRDLGLTEEQKQAVDKILRAENPIRFPDLLERLAAYSKKELSKSHHERLQEIFVQANGPDALVDPTISATLRISDDQTGQLHHARLPSITHSMSAGKVQIGDNEGRKAWFKQRQTLREEFDKAALSILTAEQRDQFKKMRGKPIDLSGEREGLPRRSSK